MKIDPSKRIGGGYRRAIQISIEGTARTVAARGGLFRGDLYVILEGVRQHMVAIPNWDNMVARAALASGAYRPDYYDPSWLMYQVYTSVYEALRYTYYVLDRQYGISFHHGEKGRLSAAREELLAINEIAAGLRRGNAQELAPVFFEKARAILEQIEEHPRDQHKRAARRMSVPLMTVFDRTGRANSTVKMVQALAAHGQLRRRQVAISSIEPVIIARRQTLKSLIEEMELFWEGLYDYLNRLFDRPYWVRGQSRCMQLLIDAMARPSMVQHLTMFHQEIGRYDIAPFTQTSYHVYPELGQVLEHIRREEYGAARKILERMWNSLKLRHIRAELEAALLPFTCSLYGDLVDRAAYDAMIYSTKQARTALARVDESGFVHPVSRHAIAQLSAALELLIQKTITSGRQAKEHIKTALGVL